MLDSLVRIARKTTFSHTYLEPASPRFRVILVNRIRKINHWTDWDLLPAIGNSKKKEEQKKKKTQQQHVDYRLEIFSTLIHEGNWAAKTSGTVIRDREKLIGL